MPLTSAAAAADSVRRMADRGARSVVVASGNDALHIILMARGDGETDHVDEKRDAFLAHGRRQARGIQRADFLHEVFGNSGFGQRVGSHGYISLAVDRALACHWNSAPRQARRTRPARQAMPKTFSALGATYRNGLLMAIAG